MNEEERLQAEIEKLQRRIRNLEDNERQLLDENIRLLDENTRLKADLDTQQYIVERSGGNAQGDLEKLQSVNRELFQARRELDGANLYLAELKAFIHETYLQVHKDAKHQSEEYEKFRQGLADANEKTGVDSNVHIWWSIHSFLHNNSLQVISQWKKRRDQKPNIPEASDIIGIMNYERLVGRLELHLLATSLLYRFTNPQRLVAQQIMAELEAFDTPAMHTLQKIDPAWLASQLGERPLLSTLQNALATAFRCSKFSGSPSEFARVENIEERTLFNYRQILDIFSKAADTISEEIRQQLEALRPP
jgi:DNA repair exonuclease SbcCD ATPase subunit